MSVQAFFVRGDRESTPFTNGGTALGSGKVVVVGSVAGVCNGGVAANEVGAFDTVGVYAVKKTIETDFTVGSTVYWNATGSPVEGDASSGAATDNPEDVILGTCDVAAADDDERVIVRLGQYIVPNS